MVQQIRALSAPIDFAVGDQVYALHCQRESEAGRQGRDHYDDSEWVEMAMAKFPNPKNQTAAVRRVVPSATG